MMLKPEEVAGHMIRAMKKRKEEVNCQDSLRLAYGCISCFRDSLTGCRMGS